MHHDGGRPSLARDQHLVDTTPFAADEHQTISTTMALDANAKQSLARLLDSGEPTRGTPGTVQHVLPSGGVFVLESRLDGMNMTCSVNPPSAFATSLTT